MSLSNVSFCHIGSSKMASYRYRCAMPAKELGAKVNDPAAEVLIFCKPDKQDVPYAEKARADGRKVIVDVCDMHFNLKHYVLLMKMADVVTCPTKWFAQFLREDYGIEAQVIPDPYEYPQLLPHCAGDNLLWYGHGLNFDSLMRIAPTILEYPLKIVSNFDGAIPWSTEEMLRQFLAADIVLMPETAPYKSPNRTVEAIRQGCFVVAEPHPALNDFPGIWIGNIRKGIEWAKSNLEEANERTRIAQNFISRTFAPQIAAVAWREAIRQALSSSTLEVELSVGTAG